MRRLAGFIGIGVLVALCAGPSLVRAQERNPGTPAPNAAVPTTSAPASGLIEVSYEAGRLSVIAEKADLIALLMRISEAASFRVSVGEGVSGVVSISLANSPLEDALKKILASADADNFAAEFRRASAGPAELELVEVRVVSKSEGKATSPASELTAGQFPVTRDGVRAYLESRYGANIEIQAMLWNEDRDNLRLVQYYEKGIAGRVSEQNIATFAKEKLEEFSAFLRFDLSQLCRETLEKEGAWIGKGFSQCVEAVPVEGTGISVSVHTAPFLGMRADLVGIGGSYYPEVQAPTAPKLNQEAAERIGLGFLHAEFAKEFPGQELGLYSSFLLPTKLVISARANAREASGKYRFDLNWKIQYNWATIYVDAIDGRILQWHKNAIPETSSGVLSGRRYGRHQSGNAGPYLDDGASEVVGLAGVHIWRRSDVQGDLSSDRLTTPPLVSTQANPVPGSFAVEDSDLPLYARLESDSFRVFAGFSSQSPQSFLSWDSGANLIFEFPDDVATGHQPNIHHQIRRGIEKLRLDSLPANDPPFLEVHAAVSQAELGTLFGRDVVGDALFGRIRLRADSGTTSDIIFHELAHIGVQALRGDVGIGADVHADQGVNEGIASYFACRFNEDSKYQFADGSVYDVSQPHLPEDWDEDGTITPSDWKDYRNGPVLASALWELTEAGESRGKGRELTEAAMWWAASNNDRFGIKDAYRPEDLYNALHANSIDSEVLWSSFSAHGMNLNTELPGIVTGVNVDWFDYFGGASGYEIERQVVGSYEAPALLTSTASYLEDREVTGGTTYRYRARPLGAPGATWSNWGYVTAGETQEPHVEIRDLEVVYEPSGMGSMSDGKVSLRWEQVGALEGFVGFKITRTAPGEPAATRLLGSDYRAAEFAGLRNGVEYTFRVVAIDANENELGLADIGTVTAINNVAPPVPGPLIGNEYRGHSALHLSWFATPPADFEGFRVHYRQGTWPGPYDGTELRWCCPGGGGRSCLDAAGTIITIIAQEFVRAPASTIDVGASNGCYFIVPTAPTRPGRSTGAPRSP